MTTLLGLALSLLALIGSIAAFMAGVLECPSTKGSDALLAAGLTGLVVSAIAVAGFVQASMP